MRSVLSLLAITCLLYSCSKSTGTENPIVNPPAPVSSGLTSETTSGILITTRENNSSGVINTCLICLNPNLSLRWKKTMLGDAGHPNCTYANGSVVFEVPQSQNTPATMFKTNLYSFNVSTGAQNWSRLNLTEYINNPILRNDTIFCGRTLSGVNGIAAYNAANGALLWFKPNTDVYPPYKPVIDGNTLYYYSAATLTGGITLTAFNLASRTIQWQTPPGVIFPSGFSALAFTTNTICVQTGSSSGSQALIAFNKSNGAIAWTKGSSSFTSVTASNDLIYSADSYLGLYSFNTSGTTIWNDNLDGYSSIQGQPFVSGENVYLIGEGGTAAISYILSANKQTGTRNYKTTISGYPNQLAVVGSNIYSLEVFSPAGIVTSAKIRSYNAATGVVSDSTTITGGEFGSLGILGSSDKLIFSQ